MKIGGPLNPSFTTLQLNKDLKTSKPNPLALQVANELDKPSKPNKYSTSLWKYETPSNHYRNSFVENQTQSYLKRLNTL